MTDFTPVPFYCEENIWQLLSSGRLTGDGISALFISNRAGTVAMLFQKNETGEEVVVWDYHVVALERKGKDWFIWDFNTELGTPCPAQLWLERTFAGGTFPEEYQACFKVIPKHIFLSSFCSDRSHMKNADGTWLKTPPSWPCIGTGDMNLFRFADMEDADFGVVLDLRGMRALTGTR